MPGSTVKVVPGPSAQIFGPLTTGATIKNNDTVNSIWVSSSRAVLPENGIEITPLGTIQWSANDKQVFACVDTGVTVPVLVTISDDANQTTDPVAVATATAIQLLASGVKIVQSADILLQVSGAGIANQYIVDVSKYASAAILWVSGGAAGTGWFDVQFATDITNTVPLGSGYSVTSSQIFSQNTVVVPCLGPAMVIQLPTVASGSLIVIGLTAIQSASAGINASSAPQISALGTQTFTANVQTNVGTSFGNGRQAFGNWTSSNASTGLDIFMSFNNSLFPGGRSLRIIDQQIMHVSGVLTGYQSFIHPLGSVDWQYRFTANITTGPQVSIIAS